MTTQTTVTADIETDAAGFTTFETAGDLLVAMAKIARLSEWAQY